jgi:hypothetical protein
MNDIRMHRYLFAVENGSLDHYYAEKLQGYQKRRKMVDHGRFKKRGSD